MGQTPQRPHGFVVLESHTDKSPTSNFAEAIVALLEKQRQRFPPPQAWRWENRQSRLLLLPHTCLYSNALSINDGGQIVGTADKDTEYNTGHAVLWQNDQVYDLNERIPTGSNWELQQARAINNRGESISTGLHTSQQRGFLTDAFF